MLKNLQPLFPYLKKYRVTLFWGALTVFFNNGIWVLFPQVIGRAVDDLNHGATRQKFLTYALLLLAVAGTKGIFQFLTRWLMIGVSREIEYDLRNDLFAHLESLPYSYFQKNRTGDIMARATNDLNAVRMLLGPAIMYTANTLVFTAAALIFMMKISPRLTLYAFAPLPLASIIIQYFGKRIHERFEKIQAQFSEISARAQENFSGARLIRAYAQEQAEITLFEKSNQEYVTRSLPLARLVGMLWPALEVMLGFAIVIVLWLGGREVLLGRISVGKFVAFNTYIMMLTWPVIALGWVINIFQRGMASMGRIHQVLSAQSDITDAAVAQDLRDLGDRAVKGEIEFRHLNFAYNGVPVLKDINLTVPAGSSLAIVGPTGSGKTTLVSLIPRIFQVKDESSNGTVSGSLLLDGRPLREYPLATLRRSIGFVPQETFLFSDSLRENIAFGVPGASDEQVRSAAQAASIASDIESFPMQYETLVGERGITLSGGQKQRTAIARAILRDPGILVLDDALASVDTYTEEKILNHLREVMRGRTTIFISHRVSTVRNADRIAVLHAGRIVELGTHDELLARNGYYTDLYNKQLLEEELEQV
ncbi:MAG TPA: ABC transporter ATP-binding protein [Candidatus Angelobacter sp.]|nr:ABC transporter ATP-binding protein [Candidatus Angelobacter sp.]